MADFPHLSRDELNQLVVEGTDILVKDVIDLIKAKKAQIEILETYPQLSLEIIQEIIRYLHFVETEVLFEVENLVKTFGDVTALDHLSYTTTANTLGLFGPNASGKSTLIKTLLGLVFPDEGRIKFTYNKEFIRVAPDFPNLPPNVTVDQWMDTLEDIYGPPNPTIDFETLFDLKLSTKLKDLSAGQSRIVALLPVFFGRVKLVILDEPTNFLDAFKRDRVLRALKKQIEMQDSKVIIASHRIDEINLLTERVLILHKGRMIADIPMSERGESRYQIIVDSPEKLRELFNKRQISFETTETAMGVIFIVSLSNKLWNSIKEYLSAGGFIHEISLLDKLQVRLGEVLD